MATIDLTDGDLFDLSMIVEDCIEREIKRWDAGDTCTDNGETMEEVLDRMRNLLHKLDQAAKGGRDEV